MSYYLIFDIGGTAVKYAVSNEDGKFMEKGIVKAYQDDFSLLLEEMGSAYDSWNQKYHFVGIAVSSPGFVDQIKGIVHGFSALPCIHEFPMAKSISERMGNLPVAIENDGNCGALGEYWKGSGRGENNVVSLVFGSGIGGGYVKEKRIGQTLHFSSSEFGFMPLVTEDGKMKSWSTYSVVNTLNKYNKEQNTNITGEELFQLAETDAVAKKYVDCFFYYMAAGCLSVGYALDPDVIE